MMQADLLMTLKEDDQFEFGSLLPGLDGGNRRVLWKVLEVFIDPPLGDLPARHRLTLHAYAYDAFLFTSRVAVSAGKKPLWKITS